MSEDRDEITNKESKETSGESDELEKNVEGVSSGSDMTDSDKADDVEEKSKKGNGDYETLKSDFNELNNKYLRLYAEFENYKKRVSKEKEKIHKYGHEGVMTELLPVIDNLELALSHADTDAKDSLAQGVEMTLKEMKKSLEGFGLSVLDTGGKPFDPAFHHAMSEVERDDLEDKTVVEEFRKGYMLRDRLIRPAMVSVSKKPEQKEKSVDKMV